MERIAKLTILYHLFSDWKLAPWVQKLIGCNKEAYAHEVSVVDPKERLMTMKVRSCFKNIYEFYYIRTILYISVREPDVLLFRVHERTHVLPPPPRQSGQDSASTRDSGDSQGRSPHIIHGVSHSQHR